MDTEKFENFLDEHGIDYKYSGQSIVFRECPECGSQKWKVFFYAEVREESGTLVGKCFSGKCGQTFSSISFLLKSGYDLKEIHDLHGRNPENNLNSFLPEIGSILTDTEVVKKEVELVSIDSFFRFEDWPDHPAVKYATKRGLPKELWNHVRINTESNSVVFLCLDGDKVVGYQERFINPLTDQKTKTSFGFLVSEFVMELKNPGKKIVVCEGPFTAISAWVYGYHAVCTFGSAMGPKQIAKIKKISEESGQPIGIAVENDLAGLKSFDKLARSLHWDDKKVFKLVSDEKDLNDALILGKSVREVDDSTDQPLLPSLNEWSVL